MTEYGPTIRISEEIHSKKYRLKGETFREAMNRIAQALADDEEHRLKIKEILLNQRFLPAGRVQSAMGSPRVVTPYNCFVSGTIADDSADIMAKATEAFQTMRLGGGIGYDFSTLRPAGALIRSLDSQSSGPLSFMEIFNAVCGTVSSAGHRRGAQMAVLRVDHPDIEDFIVAKTNSHRLTNFNISVGVTDQFMEAVRHGHHIHLRFDHQVYRTVDARNLWERILRTTWDWAEPGVLFIDRMNQKNNLWYCENIAATNPCGEQPLPPYGACLLGSFNLTKYLEVHGTEWNFHLDRLIKDIPPIVRAMDNVVDRATYPLPQQEQEAKNKRRMGLGVTGLANTINIMGIKYGSSRAIHFMEEVLSTLRDQAYLASIELAIEKGPFPLFDERLLESDFAQTLPDSIRRDIRDHGLRNSHLLSIAPTGTISLSADNVSSGIEPPFSLEYERDIIMPEGKLVEVVKDYAWNFYGIRGDTADTVTVDEHVDTLICASQYVDSACSKTVNVGEDVTWASFKDVYMKAYEGGASGCTTFRMAGKRMGILRASKDEEVLEEEPSDIIIVDGVACFIDPETGIRSCE